jgi:hypothetical protein
MVKPGRPVRNLARGPPVRNSARAAGPERGPGAAGPDNSAQAVGPRGQPVIAVAPRGRSSAAKAPYSAATASLMPGARRPWPRDQAMIPVVTAGPARLAADESNDHSFSRPHNHPGWLAPLSLLSSSGRMPLV